MSISYRQAWSREQQREARAFVFDYYVVPEWSCDLTTDELDSWFERTVMTDDTLSYVVGVDDATGAVVGAHVTSTKALRGEDGTEHWRRVLTIVVAPGYDPLAMHWNLTRTFMATVPVGASWVCNCERLVYDAVKDQPTMVGAVATPIEGSPFGPTMVEVVGYHLDELPDLIEVAHAD